MFGKLQLRVRRGKTEEKLLVSKAVDESLWDLILEAEKGTQKTAIAKYLEKGTSRNWKGDRGQRN